MSIAMLLGAGTLSAATLYAVLVVVVAHRFTTAFRSSPRNPPDSAGGDAFTRVSFTARGEALQLAAWFCAAPTSTAAVILVHGRNACRGDELRGSTFALAAQYVAAGLSVLMLDLRGHGESASARLSYGVHERRDVLGAVDFLLAHGYAPRQIGLLGASMGAVTAIGAAAEEPAIGAVVADSAFCEFADVARRQFVRLTRLPAWMMNGVMLVANRLTGARLSTHTAEHDIRQLVGRPTLIIHSSDDPFIPVAHAHRLASAAGASCWITNSARHIGSFGAMEQTYITRTLQFFVTSLLAPRCTPALLSQRGAASLRRHGFIVRQKLSQQQAGLPPVALYCAV